MMKRYNSCAVPESGAKRSSDTMRQLSLAVLIAVVIATILMAWKTIKFWLVLIVLGPTVVEQLWSLDRDLLLIGGVIITLMAIVLVAIEFARHASIAIRQPAMKQVSDEGVD